jgi:D-alanyl-D-alanine carboxypeptidase
MVEREQRTVLEDRVLRILRAAGAPGATLALTIDGTAWTTAVGSRQLSHGEPLTPGAVLPIYSVTKTMIAAAIMDLVARGQVGLDQAVVSLLPEVVIAPELTVRHLLNHSGGLGDYGGMAEYTRDLKRDPTRPWSEDEFLTRVLASGPRFAPGEGWAYSNIGYLLLRCILEATTRQSLQQVLTGFIFKPLDLRHARVVASLADMSRLAPGVSTYFASENDLTDVRPIYHPGWVSHGLVAATAAEVAMFLDALLVGRLVPPEFVRDMLMGVDVPEPHERFRRPTYGLGLMVDPDSRFGVVAGHGGDGPGYSAGAFHFPNVHGRRVTSVALVNSDAGGLGLDLAFTMVDVLACTSPNDWVRSNIGEKERTYRRTGSTNRTDEPSQLDSPCRRTSR